MERFLITYQQYIKDNSNVVVNTIFDDEEPKTFRNTFI